MMTSTVFLPPIRATVRAVIFRQGKLLVQVKRHPGKPDFLTLPGGAQEMGETMPQGIARECFEEIGAEVTVGPLLHMAEVYKPTQGGLRHQIEALFSCELPADYTPRLGPKPDRSQIDTVWADPIEQAELFRPSFASYLLDPDAPFYLGSFHG
ncbi:ADP-ribose pyrophosphatase YjhB, NUDIX family [Aliiruegeria lutimaris]|uniref:ADP-ribose pyrophosphatase YjhB, NUDIX family n=2 Tax=Aliiruegeria lutimaris TaxID=571298 RepID=A0A1G8VT93_9RHOB|nr:ADP-ribose pyrophosphatase YjhB, NUDIX family [Aliiruegeria lutimaris]